MLVRKPNTKFDRHNLRPEIEEATGRRTDSNAEQKASILVLVSRPLLQKDELKITLRFA